MLGGGDGVNVNASAVTGVDEVVLASSSNRRRRLQKRRRVFGRIGIVVVIAKEVFRFEGFALYVTSIEPCWYFWDCSRNI